MMVSSPSTVAASRAKNFANHAWVGHIRKIKIPRALPWKVFTISWNTNVYVMWKKDVSLKVKYDCQNVAICSKVSKVLRLAKVICDGWSVDNFRLIIEQTLWTQISWLPFEMWWSAPNIHQPSMLTDALL